MIPERTNVPTPFPLIRTQVEQKKTTAEAKPVAITEAPVRPEIKPVSGLPDKVFKITLQLCGLSVIAVVVLLIYELVTQSQLSLAKFGIRFLYTRTWDPLNGEMGALPFIFGTVVSSLLALLLAVPLAVGSGIFLTEMCPRVLRGAISFLIELLAAIPSVIYGLWAIFILAPLMRKYVEPFLANIDTSMTAHLGWSTGLFTGPAYGVGMLTAGIVMAIMIVPIIASITREVITAVPRMQREAVLALGGTRWEMIRMGVLRNARAGIFGAIILGLGRAFGETMAVTMVIGNRAEIARSLFAPGYTLASVIANEFSEAVDDLHRSALMEIGLVLLLVTMVVNGLAMILVWSITRGQPKGSHA